VDVGYVAGGGTHLISQAADLREQVADLCSQKEIIFQSAKLSKAQN